MLAAEPSFFPLVRSTTGNDELEGPGGVKFQIETSLFSDMSDPEAILTADVPDAVAVERTPVLAIIASLFLHVLLGLVFLQLSPGNQMQPEAPQTGFRVIQFQGAWNLGTLIRRSGQCRQFFLLHVSKQSMKQGNPERITERDSNLP